LPFRNVHGLNLHIQEMGQGPALFLTHGLLLDNLASWLFSASSALVAHHRVVLWDLRGHGMSGKAASGYDSATQAGDLAELIDQLAPGERVDLAGFSYGGLIALRCALARPERIGRLALLETPLPPRDYSEFDPLLEGNVDELLAAMPEALRREVLRSPRRALKLARAVKRLVSETTLLADVRGEPGLPEGALAGLELPVLCLYADGSPFLADGRRLEIELPRAEFHQIAGGHRLLNEKPAEVAQALTAFFAPEEGGTSA
jgi:pimeloyl-ACP methyl ester carboxylesterase